MDYRTTFDRHPDCTIIATAGTWGYAPQQQEPAMIQIKNPTGRKTECRTVTINGVTLCFSYETLIGFIDRDGARHTVANSWGPPPGRPINECGLRLTEADLVEGGGRAHCHLFDNDKLQRLALEAIQKEYEL